MIKATNLTKYYGARAALDGVSFEVAEGECVGFLGRNGAGKTTALKILATALLPSVGAVSVGGHDVVGDPDAVRRMIGFLPEVPPLYEEMTPRAYLQFVGQLRGMTLAAVIRRIDEVADETGLSRVLDQTIQTLSLGFRKRVGIAQAIVHDPQVVIVDEPISGLDPVQIKDVRELLRRLRGKHTILLSSHILTELSQTCDRFLVIDRGVIVGSGSEQDLLRSAQTTGRYKVDLEVVGTAAALDAALTGVDGVTSHEVTSEDAGRVFAEVILSRDAPDVIAAALVKAGLGVRSLGLSAVDLESIFVSLTQEEAA